tara:strand:- start:49 stop:516 length:468 start_codon:yes stop_codon:yes gene_type:complete
MIKISTQQINAGNKRASFSGNFKNNFSQVGFNPKLKPARVRPSQKMTLDRKSVDLGKFRAESASQRGFKKKQTHEGQKPVFWNSSEFDAMRVGGLSYDSGAGRGGEFSTQAGGATSYKPAFGVAGTGKMDADKPTGQINPFPVKVRKSVKKSNRK